MAAASVQADVVVIGVQNCLSLWALLQLRSQKRRTAILHRSAVLLVSSGQHPHRLLRHQVSNCHSSPTERFSNPWAAPLAD